MFCDEVKDFITSDSGLTIKNVAAEPQSATTVPSPTCESRISSIPKYSLFSSLKIAPFSFKERKICPLCERSSLMFCPFCVRPHDCYPPPEVILPLKLDIIKHPKENPRKSTALHAKILAPSQTTIWNFPDIPVFNVDETLCLFPSPDAKTLSEIDLAKFKRVVFIDCTWHQTQEICDHPNISHLTSIKLHDHHTLFWRYQHKGPEFLATIEAIYFFFKDFYEASCNAEYKGEFDNLLYYYAFQYEQIQHLYEVDAQKKVSKKLVPNYIRTRSIKDDNEREAKVITKEKEDETMKKDS